MSATEHMFPVAIMVYIRSARGLEITRNVEAASDSSDGAPRQFIHILHKNGNHYDLFRHAPAVATFLGPDISRVVAEAVADAGSARPKLHASHGCKRPACADARPAPSKRSLQPPRHVVLNAVASMSGTNSGGKTKAIKQLFKAGVTAAAAKRALKKLEQEKAIGYSQTKRSLKNGKTWRALRVDKDKLRAANAFKL